jgi:hypothetical protein
VKEDLNLTQYRRWLARNVTLGHALSPTALRELVLALLLGKNYRIVTERGTEDKLFLTYTWLMRLYDRRRRRYGSEWRTKLLEELLAKERLEQEEKDLVVWLLGLARKTAVNLDISRDDFPVFLKETLQHCRGLFRKLRLPSERHLNQVWLLLMAGAATLSIRGSQKSKVGKALEKVFLKVALTMLGLSYQDNFWLNIGRDLEVDRESDAEVQTRRGRIRMEIALISSGNQEVIEDKINRVGENGVVIFDKIGARSRVYETASRRRVSLIQIRHNQPLVALRDHLQPLVAEQLLDPPTDERGLRGQIRELPDHLFALTSQSPPVAS